MFGNWGSEENYSVRNRYWTVTTVDPKTPTVDRSRQTFTIPEVVGLEYLVDETPAGPGSYTASGPVTIEVRALTGYRLPADCTTTSWQFFG